MDKFIQLALQTEIPSMDEMLNGNEEFFGTCSPSISTSKSQAIHKDDLFPSTASMWRISRKHGRPNECNLSLFQESALREAEATYTSIEEGKHMTSTTASTTHKSQVVSNYGTALMTPTDVIVFSRKHLWNALEHAWLEQVCGFDDIGITADTDVTTIDTVSLLAVGGFFFFSFFKNFSQHLSSQFLSFSYFLSFFLFLSLLLIVLFHTGSCAVYSGVHFKM